MSEYISKFTGEEIDARLEMAETASTDIEKLEAALSERAAYALTTCGYQKKNLLSNEAESAEISGVTFTANEDGSITANGTATEEILYRIGETPVMPPGTVYISGCPEGGSADTYSLRADHHRTESLVAHYHETGSGNDPWFGMDFRLIAYIKITAGTAADNLTFYPMIRCNEIRDGSYEQYVPSLQEQMKALTAEIESASDWDLIPADYTTIAAYAESLAVGRHHAFYRNASDTHVTDMPVNANCFIEISKYSNTSIHITVHPCLLQSSANYCRSCSGGAWGGWYKFEGAEVTGGTE